MDVDLWFFGYNMIQPIETCEAFPGFQVNIRVVVEVYPNYNGVGFSTESKKCASCSAKS